MSLVISLTPGYTFQTDGTDKLTPAKLNQLGSPIISLTGSIGTTDIQAQAITTALIADDAVTGLKVADGAIGTEHLATADQGSILARTDTEWVHLAPSTSGKVLTTKGAGENVEWATVPTVETISLSNLPPGLPTEHLVTDVDGNVAWTEADSFLPAPSTNSWTHHPVPYEVEHSYTGVLGDSSATTGTKAAGVAFVTDDIDIFGWTPGVGTMGFPGAGYPSYRYADFEFEWVRINSALGLGSINSFSDDVAEIKVAVQGVTLGGYHLSNLLLASIAGMLYYDANSTKWVPGVLEIDSAVPVVSPEFHYFSGIVTVPRTEASVIKMRLMLSSDATTTSGHQVSLKVLAHR